MLTKLTVFLLLFISTHAEPPVVECPYNIPDTICYRLEVPLDHNKSSVTGSRIPFLFARVKPSVPILLSEEIPIVYLPGGPGQDGLASGFLNISIADSFNRSFIAIDPRGSGTASELSCTFSPEFQSGSISNDAYLNEASNCMSSIGPRLKHYSTRAIVEDLELMRKAFGYEKLDLLGLSYGTITAQWYALKYPNSIRSMVFDSPRPLNIDPYDRQHPKAYERIYKLKNPEDPMFFDNLKNTVRSVLDKLRNDTKLQEDTGITPRSIRRAYQTTSSKFVKGITEAHESNNYTTIQGLLRDESDFEAIGVNTPAYLAVFCNDLANRYPWGLNANPKQRRQVLKNALNARSEKDQMAFDPFTLEEGVEQIELCTAVPYGQLEREGFPESKYLPPQEDINALVLVGELDPITPIEDVVKLDPKLQSKTGIVKGSFHTVIAHTDPCPAELIDEFFFTQSVADVTKCE